MNFVLIKTMCLFKLLLFIAGIIPASAQPGYSSVGIGECRECSDNNGYPPYSKWIKGETLTNEDDAKRMCDQQASCLAYQGPRSGRFMFYCSEQDADLCVLNGQANDGDQFYDIPVTIGGVELGGPPSSGASPTDCMVKGIPDVSMCAVDTPSDVSMAPTPSPTSSPTTLKMKEINPFQVLAVGAGTAESPYGTATGNVGELVIDTFFEASSSDFNDGITIEVYSGVKDDEEDCTQGDLVPKTDYTTESLPYADYSGPKATSDGVVGIARVTIPDFTTLSSIWFPVKDGVDKDGTIKLCVVTAIKIDYYGTGKEDYSVTQLNSKRSISVALVGNIEEGGQMKQVIEVTESKATTSESKAVLSVAVDTILCNNKNDPVREDKSYVTGQQFRICVGPTADGVAKGYQVDQYLEVKCGERTLFSTEKGTDALTNIDDEKKNDKRAIRSVLTVEDAAAAAVTDGTSTFTCTGKVSLSYTSPVVGDDLPALRNLLPASTGVVVPSSGGAGVEAEAVLEGLFDVTIQMETPSMNESSSAPPGPASMTTTRTTVVAVMGVVVVGSLLSVVSFLLE